MSTGAKREEGVPRRNILGGQIAAPHLLDSPSGPHMKACVDRKIAMQEIREVKVEARV